MIMIMTMTTIRIVRLSAVITKETTLAETLVATGILMVMAHSMGYAVRVFYEF